MYAKQYLQTVTTAAAAAAAANSNNNNNCQHNDPEAKAPTIRAVTALRKRRYKPETTDAVKEVDTCGNEAETTPVAEQTRSAKCLSVLVRKQVLGSHREMTTM